MKRLLTIKSVGAFYGVPERIRTSDTRFRRAGQNAVAIRLQRTCATVSATVCFSMKNIN